MLLKFWKNKKENEESIKTEYNENFTQEKKGLDFSICYNYIDSKCQVMTQENVLFFMGLIEDYIEQDEELKISATRSDILPSGVLYNTPIKINIKSNSHVLVIYGVLKRQTNIFWIIQLNKIVKIQEHRSCFRQTLKCKGTIIYTKNNTKTSLECDLLDISLTGISFKSNICFDINEKLTIDNILLYKDCKTSYKFNCIIKREFKDENNNTCYGCMFDEMPKEIEDRLCTDIFQLQLLSTKN